MRIDWPWNIYVLIPAYKAKEQLSDFLPSLLETVPAEQICVVDDGSNDGTETICAKFSITCLKQKINRGKGTALVIGFDHLAKKNAQWILTMDADGQHAVDDIPLFIDAANKHPDSGMIIGARNIALKSMPPARIFSNSVTSGIVSFMCKQKIEDSQCGYRLYSINIIKKISIKYKRFEMESEVILKAAFEGFSIRFVPVRTLYCSTQSHISHVKDMIRWIKAVIHVWLTRRKDNR